MSVSPINPYASTCSYSSGTEEESMTLSLIRNERSQTDFVNIFGKCEQVTEDEFQFSGTPHDWEIPSFTTVAMGDCITMFGIGDDGSLFAWHCTTVENNADRKLTDKEIVLEELNSHFSEYNESVRNLEFHIYLVGGNGSALSEGLYNGMIAAVPEFFTNATIVDEFIYPTKDRGKDCITANFNTNAELNFFLHDKPSCESSED